MTAQKPEHAALTERQKKDGFKKLAESGPGPKLIDEIRIVSRGHGHAQSTCAERPQFKSHYRSYHCRSKLAGDYCRMSKKAFQKGLACYQSGDFQTALEEFNQVREAGVYVVVLIFFLGYRTGRRQQLPHLRLARRSPYEAWKDQSRATGCEKDD